ncbi:MAG: hypothetical protein ACKVOE_07120 [Rickettsiales bacterium]
MEKDPKKITSQLPPYGLTRWSTVLNGAGNGAMLAGGILYGSEIAYKLAGKKPISQAYKTISLIGTSVGAVIGGLHGIAEAKHIQEFRETVAEKINHLEQQAAVDQDKIRELYQAVQHHAAPHNAAAR